jgi:hypothetical protein
MQRILNKIAQGKKAEPKRSKFSKVTPKRVAVKLSIIDDIESELDWFEQAEGSASYMAYEWGDELIDKISDYRTEIGQVDDWAINGAGSSLEEVAGNILTNLEILEEKSNELGIDPNELYANFDELKSRVENASDLINDMWKKYDEVVEFSGVLNHFGR